MEYLYNSRKPRLGIEKKQSSVYRLPRVIPDFPVSRTGLLYKWESYLSPHPGIFTPSLSLQITLLEPPLLLSSHPIGQRLLLIDQSASTFK